jgi:hypothetical protein
MSDENDDQISEDDFSNWISVSSAVKKLSSFWGEITARETIFTALKYKELGARAETLRLRDKRLERPLVPTTVWQKQPPDFEPFWQTGNYEITTGHGSQSKVFAFFRIRFDPDDFAKMVPNEVKKPQTMLRPLEDTMNDALHPKERSLPSITGGDLERVAKLIVDLWGTSLTETNAWLMAQACFPNHSLAKHRFLAQFRKFRPTKNRGKQPLDR